MQQSVDIVNLFEQFGNQTVSYRELARDQKRVVSAERWPLVSAVQDGAHAEIPSVASGANSQDNQHRGISQAAPGDAAPHAQSVWLQRRAPAASLPARPAIGPDVMPAVTEPPRVRPMPSASQPELSPSLAGRSPLAGLGALRVQALPTAPPDNPQAALPQDLASIFARLHTPVQVPQQVAPAWSPVKGVT